MSSEACSSPALASVRNSTIVTQSSAWSKEPYHPRQLSARSGWLFAQFQGPWQLNQGRRQHRSSVQAQAQVQEAQMPPQANKRMAPEVRAQEMVDPVVAKQLALVQLEQRRKNATFARERRKEELNGALALLGVAAGLSAEANTGTTILNQVIGIFHLTGLSDVWQWIVT